MSELIRLTALAGIQRYPKLPLYYARQLFAGSEEVSQKTRGVIIPFVLRQPSGSSLTISNLFVDSRGFTQAVEDRDDAYATGV